MNKSLIDTLPAIHLLCCLCSGALASNESALKRPGPSLDQVPCHVPHRTTRNPSHLKLSNLDPSCQILPEEERPTLLLTYPSASLQYPGQRQHPWGAPPALQMG